MTEWIEADYVRVRVDGDGLDVDAEDAERSAVVPLTAQFVDALLAQLTEWRDTRGGLNSTALETLAAAGVSVPEWRRRNHMRDTWCGDVCGCPDATCIGGHHHGPDDCRCLPALLDAPAPGTAPPVGIDMIPAASATTTYGFPKGPRIHTDTAGVRWALGMGGWYREPAVWPVAVAGTLDPAPADECGCTTDTCVTPCQRCGVRCAVGTDGVCEHCYAADDPEPAFRTGRAAPVEIERAATAAGYTRVDGSRYDANRWESGNNTVTVKFSADGRVLAATLNGQPVTGSGKRAAVLSWFQDGGK